MLAPSAFDTSPCGNAMPTLSAACSFANGARLISHAVSIEFTFVSQADVASAGLRTWPFGDSAAGPLPVTTLASIPYGKEQIIGPGSFFSSVFCCSNTQFAPDSSISAQAMKQVPDVYMSNEHFSSLRSFEGLCERFASRGGRFCAHLLEQVICRPDSPRASKNCSMSTNTTRQEKQVRIPNPAD